MYIPASWHLGKGKKILVSRHDYIQEQLHFKNIVSILLLRSDHLTFVEIILLDLKMIIYSVWLNLFYLLALYVIMWTKFFKRFKIRYFQFNSLMAKSIKEVKLMAQLATDHSQKFQFWRKFHSIKQDRFWLLGISL